MNHPQKPQGFVLVNALILVAALAAVAVLLLSRAEQGRIRQSESHTATQLSLNLDAFEAFAIVQLNNSADGGPDHLNRPWTQATYNVPLSHGQVSGRITDLQGKFNVNWLADPENYSAHAAFDRMCAQLGVSTKDAETVRDLLQPGGPENTGDFARMTPPEDPVGGAVLMITQLDLMPGLSNKSRDRLRPYLTALPGDSTLNPNTADAVVLAAFLPDLPPAELDRILARRKIDPFTSVEAFLRTVGLALPEDDPDPEDLDPEIVRSYQLGIASDWFRADISAGLDGHSAQRITVLNRKGNPPQTRIIWRQTFRP